ncbi:SH3 domain-containing protein [Bacillus cereus]|nr:SH3 domain-containing protein [Bacillus cereus]
MEGDTAMKQKQFNQVKKQNKWKKPFMAMATVAVLGAGIFSVKAPLVSSNVVYADSETYRVTASSLNVRSGASPSTKSLGFVYKDQTLSVIGQEANGWYKINFKGQTGYVSGAYVEKTGSSTNTNTDAPVGKRTIFIDPGHQRKGDLSKERVSPSSNETKYKVTYGASGVATKKPEYQLTLETSLILKEELEKRGFHVMMTRTSNDVNISNIQRAQMANNANASLTVRVHADGSDDNSSVKGFSILTPENTQDTRGIYQDSLRASQTILNNVRNGGINIHGNGIFKRSDMTGFNWSKTPVVLLEIGFMSNPTEDRLLSDPAYQRRLMALTADGISKYFPRDEMKKDDITGGWYESHIRELNKKGIMVGDGNGTYWPDRLVTRAEFATLISNALKLPPGNAGFYDLNEAHPTLWEGIKRTGSAGIVKGRGNGMFDPNSPIKRDEAAIMIDNALRYKQIVGQVVDTPFSDLNHAYDKQAVQRLYGLGVVKGNGNNQFLPKGTATRGEAAALINQMLQV